MDHVRRFTIAACMNPMCLGYKAPCRHTTRPYFCPCCATDIGLMLVSRFYFDFGYLTEGDVTTLYEQTAYRNPTPLLYVHTSNKRFLH